MSDVSSYTDSENESLRKIEKDTSFSLGQYGANYITSTGNNEGNWGCITALEDTSFTALAASNWSGTTSGLALKQGVSIFGTFTAINLQSGKVVAYKKAA